MNCINEIVQNIHEQYNESTANFSQTNTQIKEIFDKISKMEDKIQDIGDYKTLQIINNGPIMQLTNLKCKVYKIN